MSGCRTSKAHFLGDLVTKTLKIYREYLLGRLNPACFSPAAEALRGLSDATSPRACSTKPRRWNSARVREITSRAVPNSVPRTACVA